MRNEEIIEEILTSAPDLETIEGILQLCISEMLGREAVQPDRASIRAIIDPIIGSAIEDHLASFGPVEPDPNAGRIDCPMCNFNFALPDS